MERFIISLSFNKVFVKDYFWKTLCTGIVALIGISGCNADKSIQESKNMPKYELPSKPDFGEKVSVHDPSIFKDDNGKYYTFGSHFAVSFSDDLIRWTQIANDNDAYRLYGYDQEWQAVLADVFNHVGIGKDGNPPGSTWAPDLIKLSGKYYMYYSLST